MVSVIDGHKEMIGLRRRQDALVELARKSFEGNIGASDKNHIVVRKDVTGHDVDIYSTIVGTVIEVNEQSYFESALRFAQEAEKIIKEDVTLRTTYPK